MVNRRDQENGDNKVGYGGDQETGKLKKVEVGNNSMGNGGNQDNQYATIKDAVDSKLDAEVTDVVDLIN